MKDIATPLNRTHKLHSVFANFTVLCHPKPQNNCVYKTGCASEEQFQTKFDCSALFLSFDKIGCVSAIQIEQALCIALNLDLIFG